MQRKMRAILVLLTMTSLLTACQNRENMESGAEKEAKIETKIETRIETETKIDMENESEIEAEKETKIETENESEVGSEIKARKDTENESGTELTNEQPQAQTGHTDRNEDGEYDSDLDMGKSSFYYAPLTEDIKARITGSSYPDTDEPLQISYEDLSYVHVLHYDFEGQVQEGELICNQAIAQDLVDIFYELYEGQYPVEKIRLIDEYKADDEASMADNNTSCFNYRTVPGRTKLSNHSYGLAIDINPLYNPYVRTKDGKELISPDNAVPYADRSADFPHKIDKNDLCYRVFIEHGFTWGGAWNSSKDYQHFEKSL